MSGLGHTHTHTGQLLAELRFRMSIIYIFFKPSGECYIGSWHSIFSRHQQVIPGHEMSCDWGRDGGMDWQHGEMREASTRLQT